MKYKTLIIATALAALAIDQGTKGLATHNLPLVELPLARSSTSNEHWVWEPFLFITHTRNEGGAFGLFRGVTSNAILAILASSFLLAFTVVYKPGDRFSACGYALVVGGALGNLIDRFSRGAVIDFIGVVGPSGPVVLNLADLTVAVGVVLLIYLESQNTPQKNAETAKLDARSIL